MNLYQYRGAGLDNIYLKNGYREFDYGGEKTVSVENVEGLHCAIAAELLSASRRLAGPEFRFLRVEMGLSQKCLANLLGVTDQALAKWEKGQSKEVPGPSERLVRALARERLLNEDGEISKLLEDLAKLDRKKMERLLFAEKDHHWESVAA